MAKVQGTKSPTKPASTGKGPYNNQLLTPGRPTTGGYLGTRHTPPHGNGDYPHGNKGSK